ncbi:MAG TPA: hypothetical protein VH442_16635 [Micromonosporaceae bacterium]|jgi:hypothetical protein
MATTDPAPARRRNVANTQIAGVRRKISRHHGIETRSTMGHDEVAHRLPEPLPIGRDG